MRRKQSNNPRRNCGTPSIYLAANALSFSRREAGYLLPLPLRTPQRSRHFEFKSPMSLGACTTSHSRNSKTRSNPLPLSRNTRSTGLLSEQSDDVGLRLSRNRFRQRVLGLHLGDVIGVRRQRQHVAAVPEPLRDLDKVDAVGQPQRRRGVPKVVEPNTIGVQAISAYSGSGGSGGSRHPSAGCWRASCGLCGGALGGVVGGPVGGRLTM